MSVCQRFGVTAGCYFCFTVCSFYCSAVLLICLSFNHGGFCQPWDNQSIGKMTYYQMASILIIEQSFYLAFFMKKYHAHVSDLPLWWICCYIYCIIITGIPLGFGLKLVINIIISFCHSFIRPVYTFQSCITLLEKLNLSCHDIYISLLLQSPQQPVTFLQMTKSMLLPVFLITRRWCELQIKLGSKLTLAIVSTSALPHCCMSIHTALCISQTRCCTPVCQHCKMQKLVTIQLCLLYTQLPLINLFCSLG